MWSPVLYTNGLSCVPTSLIGLVTGDFAKLATVQLTTNGISWLLASCVIGTGISWAGFKCQSVITATAYTVVGVINKMLTVLCNVLIWDAHASGAGIASLLVCVLGGAAYQQAPLRRDVKSHDHPSVELAEADEEREQLTTKEEPRRA